MSGPDKPYSFAIGLDEETRDAEFRKRLRGAYAAKFSAMDRADLERLCVDVAEALASLGSTFAGHPQDWGQYHRDAWAYGIVCGWEDESGEVGNRHGWSGWWSRSATATVPASPSPCGA